MSEPTVTEKHQQEARRFVEADEHAETNDWLRGVEHGYACALAKRDGEATLEEARDILATATGGRPDFEGFAAALRSEAQWVVDLYADKPQELVSAKTDAERLEALAAEVEKDGRAGGFL